MSLPTPVVTVGKLQKSLHAKAKSESSYRFYTLWDKMIRKDVLTEAYRRCRRNGGASGVDGKTFEDIEAEGVSNWLENLRQELATKQYAPEPLRRVWIPKRNGKLRPLGIPTIRDRVAQMACLLVIGPIFEADLLEEQYGFREGLDAKMATLAPSPRTRITRPSKRRSMPNLSSPRTWGCRWTCIQPFCMSSRWERSPIGVDRNDEARQVTPGEAGREAGGGASAGASQSAGESGRRRKRGRREDMSWPLDHTNPFLVTATPAIASSFHDRIVTPSVGGASVRRVRKTLPIVVGSAEVVGVAAEGIGNSSPDLVRAAAVL
jgi:hypothetical protein